MPAAAKEIVTHVPVSKLKPNPWGLEVGPPLSDEDYETLKASIERNGIQIPLIVWRHGKGLVVLSGSNRLRVAKELGLKTVPVIIREFADKHAAKMFAISDNLARRQLTTGQRAYLAYQYRQLLSVGRGSRTDLQRHSSDLRKVDAWQTAADKAGVSEGSLAAMKSIVESGDDDLLQSVLNGDKTLHAAVHAVRANGRAEKPPRLTHNQRAARLDSTTLIQGDCRKELKKIASGSVEAIVTDPPYPCIDRAYGQMTEAAWHEMMKTVVEECRRVLKPNGSAVFILQPNCERLGKMRPWIYEFVAWACKEWNVVQDAYWWAINTLPLGRRNTGLMVLLRQMAHLARLPGLLPESRQRPLGRFQLHRHAAMGRPLPSPRRRASERSSSQVAADGGGISGAWRMYPLQSASMLGGGDPRRTLRSSGDDPPRHRGLVGKIHPAARRRAAGPVLRLWHDVGSWLGQRGIQGHRHRQRCEVPENGGTKSDGRVTPQSPPHEKRERTIAARL